MIQRYVEKENKKGVRVLGCFGGLTCWTGCGYVYRGGDCCHRAVLCWAVCAVFADTEMTLFGLDGDSKGES